MGKVPTCNAGDTGDMGSIPGLGRSPGGRHSNPLEYLAWRIPINRGTRRATVHGSHKELDMTEVTERSTAVQRGDFPGGTSGK